jgi:hypothetical protein
MFFRIKYLRIRVRGCLYQLTSFMNQAIAYAIVCIKRMFVIPCESALDGGWGPDHVSDPPKLI